MEQPNSESLREHRDQKLNEEKDREKVLHFQQMKVQFSMTQ